MITTGTASGTSSYGIILVTAGTEDEARAIATTLLTEHLAACVSLFPIQSLYTWQNQLEEAKEYQLVIKTDLGLVSTLLARIQALHSYEVPEVIALQIVAGSPAYLGWLHDQVQGSAAPSGETSGEAPADH